MQKALAAEIAQRGQSEWTAALALDALNRTYTRFAPTRLVVTPTAVEDGIQLPTQPTVLPPEVIPLLEDLLATYEQIARSGEAFRTLDAQVAEAYHRMGDIRQRLGRFEAAAAAYRAAIDRYVHLRPDADASRLRLARANNELGRVLRLSEHFDEAKRAHERAIGILLDGPPGSTALPGCRYELACSYHALSRRDMFINPSWSTTKLHRPSNELQASPKPGTLGPPPRPVGPDDDTASGQAIALLEQLVREFPTVPEYPHLLARCYRDLAPGPPRQGRLSPRAGRERAVQLLRRLVNDYPQVPDYRFDLCETLGHPGGPTGRPNDPTVREKAREWLEEAVSRSAELSAQYPTVPDYAAAHARYLDQYGMNLFRVGKRDEAIRLLRQAVADQEKLVGRYPEVVVYGLWLGLMERSLGQALGDRGELPEARARLEAATTRMEAVWKKDRRLVGIFPVLEMAYRDLAKVLSRSGEPTYAAAALRKGEQFQRQLGP